MIFFSYLYLLLNIKFIFELFSIIIYIICYFISFKKILIKTKQIYNLMIQQDLKLIKTKK